MPAMDEDECFGGPPPPFYSESHLHNGEIHIEVCSQLPPVRHATLLTFMQQALGEFVADAKGVKQ